MMQFLLGIPQIVLYGCVILIAVAIAMSIWLFLQTRRIGSQVRRLTNALKAISAADKSQRRDGLSLAKLDEFRIRCEKLQDAPGEWWRAIDGHIEGYISPSKEEFEGWFLTEQPRQVLPYEIVIS